MVDLILTLRPDTCCLAVVDGSRDGSTDIEREFKRQWRLRKRHLTVEYMKNLPLDELLTRIGSLSERSVVLFMRQTVRTPDQDVEPHAALRQVVSASRVPVFASQEGYIGIGSTGGYVWQFDANGRRMAEMTRLILNGTPVRDIPIGQASYANMLDWRQLERWGIPASRVPSGSIVLNRPQSLLQDHPRWFIVGALVFVGQLGLIVGLLVERASRRRAEREVQRARENLAHLTRVSAVGELAASLAHELNQPLTGILGNARAAGHLLARGDAQPWQLKEIIRDIVEDDKRAAEVIGRMRDLVRKRTTERLPLDVHDVIRGVTQLVASDSIIRKVSVGMDLAVGALVVQGDRVQLQQVLLNLVLNGIEATASSQRHPRSVVIVTTLSDRNMVHVMVRDNGSGLVPGTERQIFDPFFTTKQSGMGMGLSIARSIVESHGGRIWATNSSERGAEFHFTLPRLAAHSTRSWAIRQSA
jgi:signal transduction histidine kinase